MEMLFLYLALFERLAWNSSLSTCQPFIGKKERLSQSYNPNGYVGKTQRMKFGKYLCGLPLAWKMANTLTRDMMVLLGWRATNKESKCLPAKGILCEIRADWDWFNQFLQLPTFNTKSGMCWMCNCTYENFKTQNAAQRACLKTKANFLSNLANMKKTVSPIWEWPWNPAVLCCPDWLHSADQGVGADIAGMLLVEIANKLPERNFRDRVSTLWNEIKDLYKTMRVEYTLNSFSPEILNKGKKPTGPPTLKAPAAQVRHMIPLLPALAQRHFNPNVPHELACQRLASFVATVYDCMECNDTQKMPKACQKLALQYIELEKEALCPSYICCSICVKWAFHQKTHGLTKTRPWEAHWQNCSQEEVEKIILDTIALRSWTGGATPLLSQELACRRHQHKTSSNISEWERLANQNACKSLPVEGTQNITKYFWMRKVGKSKCLQRLACRRHQHKNHLAFLRSTGLGKLSEAPFLSCWEV